MLLGKKYIIPSLSTFYSISIQQMASINMKILTSAHEYGKIFKARGINESLEIMDITVFTSDNSKQQTDKITRGEFIKLMGYTLSQESSLKTIKLNMKSRVSF